MKRIGLLVLVGVWAVLGFAQECGVDSVQMDLRRFRRVMCKASPDSSWASARAQSTATPAITTRCSKFFPHCQPMRSTAKK